MNKVFFVFLYLFIISGVFGQLRSFDQVFPGMSPDVRSQAFSESGYVKSSKRSNGLVIVGNTQFTNSVLRKDPGYIAESISIIKGNADKVTLLDIYNALANIRGLKGRLYDSHSKGQPVPLFEDATRIRSDRQTNAIPDPAPVRVLPGSETVYIRLKDANFGNTFYRGDISVDQNGLSYTLTNTRNISYLFLTVMKEDNFTARLYIEPIAEGILIYSIAGTDISDFIASKIHIESAISKRLAVINGWAYDEISRYIR